MVVAFVKFNSVAAPFPIRAQQEDDPPPIGRALDTTDEDPDDTAFVHLRLVGCSAAANVQARGDFLPQAAAKPVHGTPRAESQCTMDHGTNVSVQFWQTECLFMNPRLFVDVAQDME